MIYVPPGGGPVRVAPSDLDSAGARRLRRTARRRPPPAEVQARAALAADTGLPLSTVERVRDRATTGPTYQHPDDYLADRGCSFERGDAEGC